MGKRKKDGEEEKDIEEEKDEEEEKNRMEEEKDGMTKKCETGGGREERKTME